MPLPIRKQLLAVTALFGANLAVACAEENKDTQASSAALNAPQTDRSKKSPARRPIMAWLRRQTALGCAQSSQRPKARRLRAIRSSLPNGSPAAPLSTDRAAHAAFSASLQAHLAYRSSALSAHRMATARARPAKNSTTTPRSPTISTPLKRCLKTRGSTQARSTYMAQALGRPPRPSSPRRCRTRASTSPGLRFRAAARKPI